jgi:hypothetical protein
MTTHIPESISTWLFERGVPVVAGKTSPPRDPNDDDDEDEDDNDNVNDNDDIESDEEPAVIREPDE